MKLVVLFGCMLGQRRCVIASILFKYEREIPVLPAMAHVRPLVGPRSC